MNHSTLKNYYLFKGDWYDRFIELIDMLNVDLDQKFIIWEPQDRKKEHHLIVVYGMELPNEFCFSRKIWKTNEHVFDSFYRSHRDRFNLHSNFNEVAAVDSSPVLIIEDQVSLN